MTIEELKKKIKPILIQYDVKKAGLFGSVARGEQTPNSDIDILVEIGKKSLSVLDFVGIKLELEDALDLRVDLVEYSTIKPLLRKQILSEEVSIL
ncbi:hypothetical protein COT42_08105 [Candidatus Saganbacteria bacterium CG08_land_8_20_14_0_20_45_16]|uniref:Polymerase beta nucleotidyltransferase domain-containing protein n=1 Tax=Candidatus Saganbacteria bacterium CG08_land_8_20_14_0_20_45_16 TaxID=2014293 RepID=A0A2H0XU14_UNCSA|nr:MAG: hypothetical protein COT42_08105 [Candidatus Saganbacteria bacterium CG08_land_8_20_14_0_20_45_16]